jgi:hypothetical protein
LCFTVCYPQSPCRAVARRRRIVSKPSLRAAFPSLRSSRSSRLRVKKFDFRLHHARRLRLPIHHVFILSVPTRFVQVVLPTVTDAQDNTPQLSFVNQGQKMISTPAPTNVQPGRRINPYETGGSGGGGGDFLHQGSIPENEIATEVRNDAPHAPITIIPRLFLTKFRPASAPSADLSCASG